VGEDVARLRREQRTDRRRQPRRWTLGPAAPSWLRRIWTERSRKVPKLSRMDLNEPDGSAKPHHRGQDEDGGAAGSV